LKLILDEEGLDQPSEWPGGDSGITIGIGYDLGYEDNFESDWSSYLAPDEIARLKTVLGLKGTSAKAQASQFKDIKINRTAAERVFYEVTIPRSVEITRNAFPGFDDLPLDAQGALVSLVFNRGAAMHDSSSEDRRKEMRAIRDAVPNGDLQEIANQLRSMERLWKGKFQGLVNRREHEAELVESCI
jgi:GH24 family phage-related lysozyme (muramidase)